jgi:hypothetical protein
MDHALDIGKRHVVGRQAHGDQQVHAGHRRRARARGDDLHVLQRLALQPKSVEDRRGADDRRAVLVVVEDRNVHTLAQPALDDEALRGLDVLKVDPAEAGLQSRDDVAEQVDVLAVDLQVEDVDAGEGAEEGGLALHHRLGGERPDIAQAQHRRAVGDHRHEVAARGQLAGLARILHDRLAGRRHPRRIGERQVPLGGHRLDRPDRDLPGARNAVVAQRLAAQIFVHGNLVKRRG